MARRFPSLMAERYGGYSTEGREYFDHMVEFNFDYSDVDTTTRQVRKELSDLGYEIHKTFGKNAIPKSKTGGTQFYISPKITSGMNALDEADGGIMEASFNIVSTAEDMKSLLKPAMSAIGEDGKQTMLKYATRIKTGTMRQAIKYKTDPLSGRYRVRIGWTELWYKYFGFQENGTSSIPPMRSVLRTFLEMLPRVNGFMNKFVRDPRRATYK